MTRKAREVLREALTLPPKARADIASTLLHSLDVEEDSDVEAAWQAEVARRIREVYSGKVKLLSWERVRRELRSSLTRARKKA
jgi:putative addiction module component (TIGR02574 family)